MSIYESAKIYGPYKRPDGRYHVIVYYSSEDRKTVSYPKYLMEKKLQRYLDDEEEIHHIDGNIDNNSLDNLEILLDHTHRHKHRKYKGDYYTCAYCGEIFYMNDKQVANRSRNVREGKVRGPYCSKQCNGKANN